MTTITLPTARTYFGDAFDLLDQMPANSVHLVITDPPYFIDGMGDDWDHKRLKAKSKKAGVVGSLPPGMKFDPRQGKLFGKSMATVSEKVMRVLKPGGFFISFSQARLYHHLAMAAEDAGFEMRDMLGWTYEGQAKAFTMDHFVRKRKISEAEQDRIIAAMDGRKTPQLKPMLEPMILAQKPKSGTFIDNWLANETGLVDVCQSLDGKFPGNMMAVPKPSKKAKGAANDHLTVKPVPLIEHLVKLFSKEGQIVLDPFLGSGSHGIAAVRAGRKFIGFEREIDHIDLADQRIKQATPPRPANVIDLWRPFKAKRPKLAA